MAEDLIPIGRVTTALAVKLGQAGARIHLVGVLRAGTLRGRCDRFSGVNASAYSAVTYPAEALDYLVPKEFWFVAEWANEGEATWQGNDSHRFDPWSSSANWTDGIFALCGSYGRGRLPVARIASGVRLEWAEVIQMFDELGIELPGSGGRDDGPDRVRDGVHSGRGREAARWWADFAEELAAFLHEEGLPAGQDADGQGAVISRICERMTAAGKQEPSRTSIQPVISAVLRRVRSAGK